MRREQVCADRSGPGSGHRSATAEVRKGRNWNPEGDGLRSVLGTRVAEDVELLFTRGPDHSHGGRGGKGRPENEIISAAG